MFGVALAAVFLGGLAFLAWKDKQPRQITLINGKLYAIAFRTNSPGFDVSMFPGFCNFSQPSLAERQDSSGNVTFYEVQFTANWCAANTVWSVPDNVAISEL